MEARRKQHRVHKQSQVGFIHHAMLVGMIFIILFALIGTYKLILSHAATSSSVTPNGSFVYVRDGHLMLDGQQYRFTGVNAYELATVWGTNPGCGAMPTIAQLRQFFPSLAPYSLVRIWAFQGAIAYDKTTRQINWKPLDNIVNLAKRHNIKLLVVLGSQSGTCDDGYFKGPTWYKGGYRATITRPGSPHVNIESYAAYVKQIVARYANDSAIAFWEPLNEPEASVCANSIKGTGCYGHTTCNEIAAERALADFYAHIDATIRSIDPNHLISAGAQGTGQCGLAGGDYAKVIQSGKINVATVHDYSAPNTALAGDQWHGMPFRERQMAAIGVPIIVEETGIDAYDPNPTRCETTAQRAVNFQTKLTAAFNAGYQGFMPWDWTPGNSSSCSYDITTGDATLAMLRRNAFVMHPRSPSHTTGFLVGIDSKCLDDFQDRAANNNRIELWSCNHTPAQVWTLSRPANLSSGTIVNANGYCLDVRGGRLTSATNAVLYRCNGAASQQWNYNNSTHTIHNVDSGLCLDDHWSNTWDGNQIWIYKCNGTDAQRWYLKTA